MPTVASVGTSTSCCENRIAPQQKPTRQIVREEIQRQKKLDDLEAKYKNGEISKFEYTVQKAVLNMPIIKPEPSYCSFGCMA